jgi:hypothetical protein
MYTPPLMKNVVNKYFGMHDMYAKIDFGKWSLISKVTFGRQGY